MTESRVQYVCPNCHADNQDMFAGMGNNMVMCMACDHEFPEDRTQLSFMCDGCDHNVATWNVTLKDGEEVQWCDECKASPAGKYIMKHAKPREVNQ